MKTVREVSDDLGVSKSRLLQIINNLPKRKKPKLIGNKYMLNDENITEITKFLHISKTFKNENYNKENDKFFSKNEQKIFETLIETNKHQAQQIEQLQKLLENQQILLLNEQKEKQLLLENLEKRKFLNKLKFFKKEK